MKQTELELAADAARRFAARYFPDAKAVWLAGSRVYGRSTAGSDLDLAIIDDTQDIPFRRSVRFEEWPVEVFVMTSSTYRRFFELCYDSAVPTLIRMCADGLPVVDDGTAAAVRETAQNMLGQGPLMWSSGERDRARYELSEYLEDLETSTDRGERLFIAGKLLTLAQAFALRMRGRWLGEGKWAARGWREADSAQYDQWLEAAERFYRYDDHRPLADWIDKLLAPYGRLFDGFEEYAYMADEE